MLTCLSQWFTCILQRLPEKRPEQQHAPSMNGFQCSKRSWSNNSVKPLISPTTTFCSISPGPSGNERLEHAGPANHISPRTWTNTLAASLFVGQHYGVTAIHPIVHLSDTSYEIMLPQPSNITIHAAHHQLTLQNPWMSLCMWMFNSPLLSTCTAYPIGYIWTVELANILYHGRVSS